MSTVEEKIQEALDTNATELDLSFMRLTTLPESIGNLTNLKTLEVQKNQLTTLPDSIGNLTNLKELYVYDNKLTTLPESIGNLTNLEKLDVYDNLLTTLPDSIGNLTNLERLDVRWNQLTTLPDSIGNLTNLKELNVHSNQLTNLHDSIGNLTNLKELIVNKNQLTTLHDSIGNLTNLEGLDVGKNQLTTLPDWIGNLTNLEELYVYNNQLTTLPDSIGNLTSLIRLYLGSNQLTTLPDSIGNLTNLNYLDVDWNENLTINRSLLNRMENNDVYIEMDNNVTIIEDVPRPLPQGIAYEVHREFQKTYQTMLENFRIMGQYLGNYGIQDIQGFTLQNKYSSTEMNLLYSFMNYFVHEKYNGDKNKNELVTKIDSIFDKIKDSSFDIIGTEYIVNVKTTLLFISKVNNPIMINYYVEAFIEDCIQAYGQGSGNTSCVLGIQERFVLTFNIMFRSVCCQQKMCANDNISQDVLDIMCPVNKDMIIEAISKKEPSNSYIQQWSMNETYEETYKNQNESQRKEHVVDYLTNQFTEGIQDATIKSEIRNEIANKINKMIDENKANFTCNELFDVFTNPSGCDSTPQQGGKKKKTRKGKKKHVKGKRKGKKKTRKGKKKHVKGKRKGKKKSMKKRQKGGAENITPTDLVDVGIMNNCWNSTSKTPIDDYYYRISTDESNREEGIQCILNKYNKETIFFDNINKKKITNDMLNTLKDGLYTYAIVQFEDGNDYMALSPVLSTLEINAKHACLPILLKNKYEDNDNMLLKEQESKRYYDINVYAAGNILKQGNSIIMDFYSGTFFQTMIEMRKYEDKENENKLSSEEEQQTYFNLIQQDFFNLNVGSASPLQFSFSYIPLPVPSLTIEHLEKLASCGFHVYRSKNKKALGYSYDFIKRYALEKKDERFIAYLKEIEDMTPIFNKSAIV